MKPLHQAIIAIAAASTMGFAAGAFAHGPMGGHQAGSTPGAHGAMGHGQQSGTGHAMGSGGHGAMAGAGHGAMGAGCPMMSMSGQQGAPTTSSPTPGK
jgi:hypothetical protein